MSVIPMYWWRDWEDDPARVRDNFGDALGPVLVEAITERQPVRTRESPRLLAAGSILDRARRGDTVWGSGVQNSTTLAAGWSAVGVEILTVRGPMTRQFVLDHCGNCPEIYGDPASLLPRYYPMTPRPIHEWALMPHLGDAAGRKFARDRKLPSIDPSWPWRKVVEGIVSCAALASSSLHGIIVAEAYGIPAVWTAFTRNPEKFHDYYLATGRIPPSPVPWSEALRARPMEPPQCTVDERLVEVLEEWIGRQGSTP